MFSRFMIFVFLIYSSNAALAPFINKCKAEDSKCIKEASQIAIPLFGDGIPELGVERLDPFYMDRLDSSSRGLKLLINDITGTGLKDCIAKEVSRDVLNSKIFVKLQCNVDFTGKYEIDGNLLFLPIRGKGDARVILKKILIFVDCDLADYTGNDGERHWTVKKWSHRFELKDKSTVELSNLFDGNEILGSAARELIANNSNEVVKEVGPPIVSAIVEKIIENIQRFIKNVPASELELL